MIKKTESSLLWRLFALASAFALSTTVAIAAPYRQFFMPGAYGWSQVPVYAAAQYAAPVAVPYQQYAAPAPQYAAPGNYNSYGALRAPSAPTNIPFGGAEDYMSAVTQQGTYRWEEGHLPIKIYIGDGSGVFGYKPEWRQIVANSFDEWCRASGDKLAWVQVNSPAQADITVRWTSQVTQRPEGTEAGKTDALTRLNTGTGQGIIYGARMQFLTALNGRPFSTYEESKTILHECGHALGLQGHSPYRDDIMYYAINPNQRPELTERDRNTLAELYQTYPVQDAVALAPHTIK